MTPWHLFNALAFARRQRCLDRARSLTTAEMRAGLPTPTLAPDPADAATLRVQWPVIADWPARYPPMVVCESQNALAVASDWLLPELDRERVGPRWLDVGSKNGAALPGLALLAQRVNPGRSVCLTGVELDAGRRYRGGQRRVDHGVTLADWLSGPGLQVRYVPGDVRWLTTPQDVVTWFLPFVFATPHLNWGLPRSRFKPQAVLDHVVRLLAPGGLLFIVNLNAEEAEAQAVLIAACPIPCRVLRHGPVTDRFLAYGGERLGWLLQRT